MPLIVEDLALWAGDKPLVNALNFKIPTASITCVLGPTGSGKTRLLEAIAGLVSQWSGDMILSGKSQTILTSRRRARLRGLLLPMEQAPFPMSVEQRVSIALWPRRLAGFARPAHAQRRLTEALRICDLQDHRHQPMHTLSVDALRRVDFASLIAQNPPLWLLDEPNNYLSTNTRRNFLDRVVTHIKSKNAGCLMTLHDTGLAQRYADQVIMLTGQGKAIMGPPDRVLIPEVLSELTGRPVVDTDRDSAGL